MSHSIDGRRNKYDKKDALEIGDRAEVFFKQLAASRGWKLEEASEDCNINEHWDFLMAKGDESYLVDIKGMKRLRRSDPFTQDEWIWVELHGVRPYDNGWLYNGKADLITLIEQLIDLRTSVHRAEDAKYRTYRRPVVRTR